MGSLYIGGAQCVHAQFNNDEDWREFDSKSKDIKILEKEFDVAVDRYCLDENDYSFVIMNKSAKHKCFYSGAAFKHDMSIEVSDTFEKRASDFIDALNAHPNFSVFHHLKWSQPEVLYFVRS